MRVQQFHHCISTFIVIVLYANYINCNELIEMKCTATTDCKPYSSKAISATCMDNTCSCFDTTKTTIVPCTPQHLKINNRIGDKCPCANLNTSCSGGICVCHSGFIESSDKLRCIPKSVKLSGTCESDDQCIQFDPFSACQNQTCTCLTNFTMYENSCRSMVKIGERCDSSEECRKNDDNIECTMHKCLCNKNFIGSKDGNNCLSYGYYNDTCKETPQCLAGLGVGSVCDNGACVCDGNHTHFKDSDYTLCKRKVNYGDECIEHSDCYSFLDQEPKMHCYSNTCVCRDDFYQVEMDCFKKSSSSSQIIPQLIAILGAIMLIIFN